MEANRGLFRIYLYNGSTLYDELDNGTSLEVATPRASNSVVAGSDSASGGVAGATGGRVPMALSGSERRLSRERGGKEPRELSGSERRPSPPSRARRLPKMRPKPPGRLIRRETPHAPPMRARAAALAPTAIIAALTGASGGGAHGGGSRGELWPPGGDGDEKEGGVEEGGKISGWAGDGGAVDVALPCLPI